MARRTKKEWKPDGYIFAALRKIWRWSPARRDALRSAGNDKTGYACAACSKRYNRKGVAVDHVSPVVEPSEGFQGWEVYIHRLFCPASGLQILCKPCHSAKSKEENAERRKAKKLREAA
jgi:5-methylcytosine-specific restriction endonuclease McrA